MTYLYEEFDALKKMGAFQVELPAYLQDNLKYRLRPYQIEAFQRYIYFDTHDFEIKPAPPYHLLYNMATGSGKTLVMAGLILYLYKKGYRNFMFFVNSNNIIKKTKDNFLNPLASKYLYAEKILIDGKEVKIKEVNNFDEADDTNINLKFVSIQKLSFDFTSIVRENGLSYEDFSGRKTVLIGDEAHHNNAKVWDQVVKNIHRINPENILLEFTATLDFESRKIVEKYKDKVIFKYDLAQFRLDGYSKEINLIRSYYDEKERIIQALILNLYRGELAVSKAVNLKPVILFKAKRTIAESRQNKQNFHQLIDELSAGMIEKIKTTSTIPVVQKAFAYFEKNQLSFFDIAQKIKVNFKEENCISANNDKEAEKNQILLNTLEDENNPVRAVFAVQKLNEGWDVLNLFDIVRLYNGRDGRAGKPGKTTLSEAQLIGRGARYFPFVTEVGQDPYTRKFDDDISNDLRVLEELYYHTREDNRYISELKKALIDTGIYEDEEKFEIKQLQLKSEFKQSPFYQTGKIIFNRKVPKNYNKVKSFADLGVKKRNHVFTLSSGKGVKTGVFYSDEQPVNKESLEESDLNVSAIPPHVIRFALSQNPFFYFDNLIKYFPHLDSLSAFINDKAYLGGLEITFKGTEDRLRNLTHADYLQALQELLIAIEKDIKKASTEYEGSDWTYDYIRRVFTDKELKLYKDSERAYGQEDLVADKPWYVYNANYGTAEEKNFVELFARLMENYQQKFEKIYLIRNERQLKIYDQSGRAFEPDYILFVRPKAKNGLTYQVFIEPKGKHLKAHEKWKEEFLQQIGDKNQVVQTDDGKYLISAVPFYTHENENEFKEKLENLLRKFSI